MALKVTDWYPIDTPPVHIGEYDVVPKSATVPQKAFKDELSLRAVWCKRHGQFGFWVERRMNGPEGDHKVSQMLDVLEWRGTERPKLSDEGKAFMDAQLFALGNVSAPLPRQVLLFQDTVTTDGSKADTPPEIRRRAVT